MLIRIASRSSFLAKWQAYQVGHELLKTHPKIKIEYQFRESLGDKNLSDPLWKMPEKGVFTEDFYQDLIQDKTDLIVHSWKDLPTEKKDKSFIAATLKRADQRDLLLFKKTSLKKSQINIYTSSPRRVHHLDKVLRWSLPFNVEDVEFIDVRGNIQTRIQKLINNESVDGLILAKAALDRLMDSSFYKESDFLQLQNTLTEQLSHFNFQILPLSENPTAAAQGALAIEILRTRTDLIEILNNLNSQEDFNNCAYERSKLAEFGGGCHQKIGLSCLNINNSQVFFSSGQSEKGYKISQKSVINPRKFNFRANEILTSSELWSNSQKKIIDFKIENQINFNNQAVFITKKEAINSTIDLKNCFLYTAGIATWKHLAEHGIWIHGSTDSLGEDQLPVLNSWIKKTLKIVDPTWYKITHKNSPIHATQQPLVQIHTYQVENEKANINLDQIKMIYWKSGFEYLQAVQFWPELKKIQHACGLGHTAKTISSQIGPEQVTLYYNEKNWREHVLSTIK